ncbi:RimJ/RimL family protein N-acetyltransferase [Micromonospora sp. M71_S20]|uniref:GNAT family N-acetyltransferase n=1 Tax=Micromonospora sp. M71_S20 TaxID=592872 RepID=UPI000EB24835|nr:GNAT family N-acetyltransferase [Micromonospora sp. M71_S20]RLK23326.1 RimJ/RimL family protein N-acetyltransferase [Micromonospora sp. M71_S20]
MTDVRIEPWCGDDLDLLRRLNAPEIREHTGGPETDAQVVARHERYVRFGGTGQGCMYSVVLPDGSRVGSVGYWEREWHDQRVYELGWAVLPGHQGRGLATAAVRAAVAVVRARRNHRWAHAYPSVDNAPSNAVCRKAGFTLLGETEFEYPPGRLMRANDWRLDLAA